MPAPKVYARKVVRIDIDDDGEKEEVVAFLLAGSFVLKLRRKPPRRMIQEWRKVHIKPGVTGNVAILKPEYKGKRGGRTVLTSIWYDLDHLAEVAIETRRLIYNMLKSLPEDKLTPEHKRALAKFKRMKLEEAKSMEVRNVPISRLKWINRPRERAKLPKEYFLLPDERKFPYRNKDGSINCYLLRAAIVRAAQHGYPQVEKKARSLYQKYCKKEQEDFAYVTHLSDVELAEENILVHNILPFGTFIDPRYGKVEITKEFCEQMVENFKKGYPHYPPPLNIGHDNKLGKYGEVIDLEVREDGLYAKIRLTDEGVRLLEEEKFEFLSAEYAEHYLDKNTGEDVGPVLLGVALTNTPAHPGMQPIEFVEEIINGVMLEDLLEDVIDGEIAKALGIECGCNNKYEEVEKVEVKELEEKLQTLETEKKELEEKYNEAVKKLEELEKENAELKKKVLEAEVDLWAKKWLEEGIKPVVVEKAKKVVLENPAQMKVFDEMFESLKEPELLEQKGQTESKVSLSEKVDKLLEAIYGRGDNE